MPREKRPAQPLQAWAATHKPLTHLLTEFTPMLKVRGVTDADIDTMLRDNPRRLLTGGA
jgi:predicted metal-dependent phosphotriesterase family hydrolase